MAADGELTRKSKGRTGWRDGADIGEFVEKDRRLDINEMETIPTMVPLLSDRHRGCRITHSEL